MIVFMKKNGFPQRLGLVVLLKWKVLKYILLVSCCMPDETHAYNAKYWFHSKRSEKVEETDSSGLFNHNVLKFRITGMIIDITLVQFLGSIEPDILRDLESFQ